MMKELFLITGLILLATINFLISGTIIGFALVSLVCFYLYYTMEKKEKATHDYFLSMFDKQENNNEKG